MQPCMYQKNWIRCISYILYFKLVFANFNSYQAKEADGEDKDKEEEIFIDLEDGDLEEEVKDEKMQNNNFGEANREE